MNFVNILFVTFFVVCLTFSVFAAEEEAPKRVNLHGRRPGGRNPLRTTTTTIAPEDEDVPFDEDEPVPEPQPDDDDSESAAPVSTTSTTTSEPTKAPRPSVRPFRSNTDLLNALKRRQESIKAGKKPASYKPVFKESSTNNLNEDNDDDEDKVVSAAPATPSPLPVKVSAERVGRKRYGSNRAATSAATKPTAAAVEEPKEQPDAPEPVEAVAEVDTLVKRPGRSRFTYRQYKH